MSSNTGETTGDVAAQTGGNPTPDPKMQLELLKNRARIMGINFSNNIGLEALSTKIDAKLADKPDNTDDEGKPISEQKFDRLDNETSGSASAAQLNPLAPEPAPEPERKLTLGEQVRLEQLRLVRLRITNLDPKKRDLPGEVITVANEYMGTVRKFVPFGEATDNGYHVPWCIYQFLKARRFLSITTTRDPRRGTPKVNQRWVAEFALEVLEPLTETELRDLGQAQIAAGSVENTLGMDAE